MGFFTFVGLLLVLMFVGWVVATNLVGVARRGGCLNDIVFFGGLAWAATVLGGAWWMGVAVGVALLIGAGMLRAVLENQ